jgi:hypothetical protein
MKLAGSSASFETAIAARDLTQLEWLDLAARELALDGVVFDARHFPRLDDEYLAQLKKMATDLGLTVAGLSCDAILADAEDAADDAERWLAVAAQLAAPLVLSRTPPAADQAGAWNDLAAAAKTASRVAKRLNVTVAVRNAPGTLCSGAADLKRLAKDVDSAWLRFALDARALDPPEPPEPLIPKTVVAAHATRSLDALESDEPDLGGVLPTLGDFRGFLVVDYLGEPAAPERVAGVYARLRGSIARQTLALASE